MAHVLNPLTHAACRQSGGLVLHNGERDKLRALLGLAVINLAALGGSAQSLLSPQVRGAVCRSAHTHMHVHTRIRACAHTHAYTNAHAHLFILTHTHTHAIHTHAYAHSYIHTFVRTFIHSYVHTHTYTHTGSRRM